MAKRYDPLPDLATVLAGVCQVPAYMMPAGMIAAYGRLTDRLWPGSLLRCPLPDAVATEILPDAVATEIEVQLRGVLTGKEAGDG